MDRLWAPWRMAYIERSSDENGGDASAAKSCIFCEKPNSANQSADFIISKSAHAFVLLNIYPYANGHLMVAPFEHTSSFEMLSPEVTTDMMMLVQKSIKALAEAFHPHGFNTGMNLGSAAGAGIAQHLHMHVVPRWIGDANFMPVIGDTKVLPDSLESVYARIMNKWVD